MTPDAAFRSGDEPAPAPWALRKSPAPQPPQRGRVQLTVLIVDDVADTRELYATYFQMEGYKVVTAHDGLTGVEAALRYSPDVIVMDLSMPGIDGVEATRRLKAQASDLRILLLTAYPMHAIERGALEAGADGFLTKPCLPEDLETHVRRLLSRPPGAPGKTDAAKLAALLRRMPRICTRCLGTKLSFSAEQITAATEELSHSVALEQNLGECPICGRTQWVVTLAQ